MLRTNDLDYDLPPEQIATFPAEPRDTAKLMVIDPRSSGLKHTSVWELPRFLKRGDLLVLNTTAVLPARLAGVREDSGGAAHGLYVEPAAPDPSAPDQRRWRVLIKMRRFKEGARVRLMDRYSALSDVTLELVERVKADAGEVETGPGGGEASGGGWIVNVHSLDGPGVTDQEILSRVGLAPLPPYILASRKRADRAKAEEHGADAAPQEDPRIIQEDLAKYQTVFADPARAGSVAAPTAGLHFTPDLLKSIDRAGVKRAAVTLHVGLGTFKPVETEFVEDHPMHAEWCTMPRDTAAAIIRTKAEGGRVIAVGTTSARTLESFDDLELVAAGGEAGSTMATRLLITPGYQFKHVDGLMTNFHLPRSTLLAMVAALEDQILRESRGGQAAPGAGLVKVLAAYKVAVQEGYRFYSYGDAMLLLP